MSSSHQSPFFKRGFYNTALLILAPMCYAAMSDITSAAGKMEKNLKKKKKDLLRQTKQISFGFSGYQLSLAPV